MRATKLSLVCILAIVVALGCQSEKKQSEKKASTEKTETPQASETAVSAVEEIALSVSNMT